MVEVHGEIERVERARLRAVGVLLVVWLDSREELGVVDDAGDYGDLDEYCFVIVAWDLTEDIGLVRPFSFEPNMVLLILVLSQLDLHLDGCAYKLRHHRVEDHLSSKEIGESILVKTRLPLPPLPLRHLLLLPSVSAQFNRIMHFEVQVDLINW